MIRRPPRSTLFPTRRSSDLDQLAEVARLAEGYGTGEVRLTVDQNVIDPHVPDARLGNRSEEHTSELQSPCNLVCRLLLEKKKIKKEITDGTQFVHDQDSPRD